MVNTAHILLSRNSVNRRLQQGQRETPVRGVVQDKPLQDPAPPSLTTASPSKKMTRGGLNGHKNQSFTKIYQNHAITRPKEKVYIWLEHDEKSQLKRIAESKELSVSQTGRAMIVDCIRQELRIERDVLAVPILEAFFDKKMNRVINVEAEYLGRILFEIGQLRLLYVNTLLRENNLQITEEADVEKKKQLRAKYYKLLDDSQNETVKAVKDWNPSIQDMVAAVKEVLKAALEGQMKEGKDT